MKTADAVITVAREHNLQHFFGIPGGGAPLDLIEAGRKFGVRFVNMSHESSAAIAAAYYGVMKRTAGLAMGIRGVGAANLVGGVANVYFERQPLVAICEAAPASAIRTESVQDCEQQRMFEAVSGFQATLTAPAGAEMIRQAFGHAVDGRPSPSVLHWPAGLNELENPPRPEATSSGPAPSAASLDVQRAHNFLAKTRRPVVLAGADVIRNGALDDLLKFVESIEAAVLVAMDARGVFPESHPRWAGVFLGLFNPNVMESRVFQQADGIILAGVDAMMTHAPWKLTVPTCELVARPQYTTLTRPEVRVDGNLKAVLSGLTGQPRPGITLDEIRAIRNGILAYFQRPSQARLAAQDVIQITRELLPRDGVLISETGAFICMLEHLWPVDRPGTYLGTSGGRTMGLMIPAALGARMADSERPMVGMGADGSLLMRLGELEVFARTGTAIPLVIVNDRSLGTMKSRQRSRGFTDFGLDLHAVDFAAIARACGLRGVVATTPEAFRKELSEAMAAKVTTVIDAQVDPEPYHASFAPTIGILE